MAISLQYPETAAHYFKCITLLKIAQEKEEGQKAFVELNKLKWAIALCSKTFLIENAKRHGEEASSGELIVRHSREINAKKKLNELFVQYVLIVKKMTGLTVARHYA